MSVEIKKALEEIVALFKERREIYGKIEQQKEIIRQFTKGNKKSFRRKGFASIHVAPLKTRRLSVEPTEVTKVSPEILSELIKEKTIFVRLSEAKFDALDETIKSQLLDSNFIQILENPDGIAKQAVRVRFLDQKNTNNEDTSSTPQRREDASALSALYGIDEDDIDEEESEKDFQDNYNTPDYSHEYIDWMRGGYTTLVENPDVDDDDDNWEEDALD